MFHFRKHAAILTGALCLFVAACGANNATQSYQNYSDNEGVHTESQHNFMDLFKDAKADPSISELVLKYIEKCCETDEQQTVALLKRNGFKVHNTIQKCEQTEYNEGNEQAKKIHTKCLSTPNKIVDARDYRKQGYDEVYIAEKHSAALPHLYAYKVYKVTLFIKDHKILKVTAGTHTESL